MYMVAIFGKLKNETKTDLSNISISRNDRKKVIQNCGIA